MASELSLDLSKVLMGSLAFFKLLISIFLLLPSSSKRKIHIIHQQLSSLKCSAEGLVFVCENCSAVSQSQEQTPP